MCIYESRLVGVGKGCSRPVIMLPIWVYHSLPWADYYTQDWACVNQTLTIPYRTSDRSLNRPQEAFTNYYHRTEHITHSDDAMCYVGL